MEFIREKIKEKPISKKKVLTSLGIVAICGLVFVAVVCAVIIIEGPGIIKPQEIEGAGSEKDTPYVGVSISTVTEDIAEDYNIPKGVYIREVAMDSPAMKAGIQSGDVITRINGETIATDMLFTEKISQLIPGTTCEISLKRQNGDAYYDVTCVVTIGVLQ